MFNLRRYFSLTSALVIVVVTVLLAMFFRQHAVRELVEYSEQHNVALARSFANVLWPRFSAYVTSDLQADGDALRSRPKTREIHEAVETLMAGLPVLKVKIYNLDGLTVYSSEPSQIGADRSGNPGFLRAARDGAVVSKLSYRDTFSAFSGIVEGRDLVESYLPIRGDGGRIEGVFELYTDVTPLVSRIGRGTNEFVIGLLLAFGLLYGSLFLIVRRADRILKRQYLKLQDGEERIQAQNQALREAHETLERRVQERTAELESEIDERVRAEEALRDSEERFRAVVNNSPTKIHIKDLEGRYVLVNKEAEELFGVTDEEARGKTTHELFPDEQADSFKAHDQAVLDTGQTIAVEEEWLREDGVHTFLTVKFPILDSAGDVRGVGAIGTDITEHKRAQEALEQMKQRNELLLRSAGEGIYGLDIQGRTTFVNPAAAKMIGWKVEELLGKAQHDILHHTKPDGSPYPRDECPIYAAFKDGSVQHVSDEVFWRKDGSSFPVAYVSTPIREGGEITGAVVVFRDISDRKRAQEAVLAAKEQAEQANRTKSEFLANMSHELRTPLNAIIGFSEIIETEALGPVGSVKYRDYATDIHNSGKHLLDLINGILDLSKVESGTDELSDERIEIPRLLRSIMTLIQISARKGGVTLETQLADDLPLLRGDRRKLKQILLNLVSNAIKFTTSGGTVTIRAGCHVDRGHVFQVIDTGIGIAPEDIPKALSPFQQIDSALNRKYEGTGLGLPLTTALIEMHGGSLDLQSEIGLGTTVTVRFPAERIEHLPDNALTSGVADKEAG